MNSDIVISAKNISKSYLIGSKEKYLTFRDAISNLNFLKKRQEPPLFWALKDVSFEIKRGEVFGIIGKNGAGKSTLLKILSRITEPTSGQITIHGRVASLLEVGTGFNQELTGRENIFLNGAIMGMTRKEIRKKFDQIVDFSGVEKFLDTPVKRYSSGMYIRLAFSIAAHLESEILIVDEVLAVGDAEFQKKCLGKMNEIAKQEGRTILFVSHNIGAVKNFCSKCMLFENGKIKKIGDTETVAKIYSDNKFSDNATHTYKNDSRKNIQINKIVILDHENKPNIHLEVDKAFSIKINYTLRKDISINNFTSIGFYDSSENTILLTYDIDTNEQVYKKRDKGNYTVIFNFPPNIFNQQNYLLKISCGVPAKYSIDNDANFFDIKENIVINLTNNTGFSKKFFGGYRSGFILTKIPSEIIFNQ